MSINQDIRQLKAKAWARHRVYFDAATDTTDTVIRFWNFYRAGAQHHLHEGTSEKGSGRKVLAQLCEIADRHGASIQMFCGVQRLIDGLYADFGFTEDRKPAEGCTRYFTRKPKETLQCDPSSTNKCEQPSSSSAQSLDQSALVS